jgi:hypothetical protein
MRSLQGEIGAMTFRQNDLIPSGLAEAVTAIGGDRDHSALQ